MSQRCWSLSVVSQIMEKLSFTFNYVKKAPAVALLCGRGIYSTCPEASGEQREKGRNHCHI